MPCHTDDVKYKNPIVTIQGIDVMRELLARLSDSTPDPVTVIEDEICIEVRQSPAASHRL